MYKINNKHNNIQIECNMYHKNWFMKYYKIYTQQLFKR